MKYSPKDSWLPLCGLLAANLIEWKLKNLAIQPNWAAFIAFAIAIALGMIVYEFAYPAK
jgi:hypothetical protein